MTAFTAGVFAPAASAAPAQPTFSCDNFGYLFQTVKKDSTVHQVNLTSGAATLVGNTPHSVNGVGYNVLDEYMYGTNGGILYRIGSDLSMTALPPIPELAGQGFAVGDIDTVGRMWIVGNSGSSDKWASIDLVPGSPTYGTVINTGPNAQLSDITDWAAIGNALYGVKSDGTGVLRFDMTTHAIDTLPISGLTERGRYGAAYADSKGRLWASHNDSGAIWRINIKNQTAVKMSDGPTSSGNDGARCSTAEIPSLIVEKQINGGRVDATDQFTVAIRSAQGQPLTEATTAGSGNNVSTTDWPVMNGYSYQITDTIAPGSASPMSKYRAEIACTNLRTGSAAATTGTGPWTLAVSTNDSFSCVVTNTNGTSKPTVSITKSSDTTAITAVGQKVPYKFEVKNTGNVAAKDITVIDRQTAPAEDKNLSPISCPATTLDPGKSMTCTAEYTVSQADYNHGKIKDVATMTSKDPGNTPIVTPPSEKEIPVVGGNATVSITKSSDTTAITAVGQKVPYKFEVKNTGNVAAKDITVIDRQTAPAEDKNLSVLSCPATTLDPGKSMTCTAEYTVSQADYNHGKVKDVATLTSKDPGGTPITTPPSEKEIPVVGGKGDVSILKSTDTKEITAVGQKVPYKFEVTNKGTVTAKDIKVTDKQTAPAEDKNLSPISCPATTLDPGKSMTCTAEYTVSQADFDHGKIKDVATMTSKDPSDKPITTPPSEKEIPVVGGKADVSILKSTDTKEIKNVGQKVPYKFEVKNNGTLTAKDIKVTDKQTAPAEDKNLSAISCPATTLDPGKSMTCAAEYTVSQADFDHGKVKDVATVTSNNPGGTPIVTPPSEKEIPVVGAVTSMTVAKSSTAKDITSVGQKVPYKFTVKNTGNVTLNNVNVQDTQVTPADNKNLSKVVCPATSLAPGQSTDCSAEYTVSQADFDHGSVTDIAEATAKAPMNIDVVSNESTLSVGVTGAEGALKIVKSSTATAITGAGQKVPYTFDITNTGNVTMKKIKVTDKQTAPAEDKNLSPIVCPGTELAPGKSMKCTAEYTVSQADFDHGSIKDVATATGEDPKDTPVTTPPGEKEIVSSGANPSLAVVKSSTATEITGPGQKIPYAFQVTNNGNVTMKDIKVEDTQVAPADNKNLSPVTCKETTLAPGISTTCNAEYTVSQADYDHGKLADTAVATGKSPKGEPATSPPAEKEITATGTNPDLAVVKSSKTAAISEVGQVVPYTFSVTNTGNVTMKDLKVTDEQIAPANPANLTEVKCPESSLAPGKSMDCTAEYRVAQADFDHGKLVDAAVASGTSPQGDPVLTPASEKEITTTGGKAELTVVKSSTATELPRVGEKIPYEFLVINTGNLTVNDVKITDEQVAPAEAKNLSAVSCPEPSLAPGKSMTCTAEYTTSFVDKLYGSVTDRAIATGTTVQGDPIESKPSEKIIKRKGLPNILPLPIPIPIPGGDGGLGSLNPGGSLDGGSSNGQPANGGGGDNGGNTDGGNAGGNGNGGNTGGGNDVGGNTSGGNVAQSGNGNGNGYDGNGARIDSGGGAGESGVNTGLLVAGGVVLLAALALGGVLLRRRNASE
ncbi:DUF7507 domain-containing protein [Rhodococcus sp. OK302]|uniref:DUF7507 domain-containing protein n=1 Tax=Rhodococcus sp. OK302 TaxID=1882769 RepID=UPI0015952D86|nr:DUF11 domain-containing protein [Rhodococcus sp. OK302]